MINNPSDKLLTLRHCFRNWHQIHQYLDSCSVVSRVVFDLRVEQLTINDDGCVADLSHFQLFLVLNGVRTELHLIHGSASLDHA